MRVARRRTARRLGAALAGCALLLGGCALLPGTSLPLEGCRGALRSTRLVPGDFLLRYRVRVAPAATTAAAEDTFTLVAEKQGDRLALVALSPLGAKLFSLVQRDTSVHVDALPRVVLPVDPLGLLRAFHRVVLRSADVPGKARRTAGRLRVAWREGERIEERYGPATPRHAERGDSGRAARDGPAHAAERPADPLGDPRGGRLVERRFGDPGVRVVFSYADAPAPGAAADRAPLRSATLHDPACAALVRFDRLEARRLAPASGGTSRQAPRAGEAAPRARRTFPLEVRSSEATTRNSRGTL